MYLESANLPPTRDNKKDDEDFILSEDEADEADDRRPTRGQYYVFNQQFDQLPTEDYWSKGWCVTLARRAWRSEHQPGCTGPSGVRAGGRPFRVYRSVRYPAVALARGWR